MNAATVAAPPHETDLVVLGSGVAGLTAALTAALEGLRCMVLEHLPVIGGTSARSSGTVWLPDNRYMREAGQPEDGSAARAYLDALVGDRAPREMRMAFLEIAPRMQADLEDRAGIGFRPYPAAPDYRQDMPGAAPGWRALEPLPFDGRLLGERFAELAPPLPELMLLGGMMVTRAEAAKLLRADRSLSSAALGARLVGRFLVDRLSHGRGTRLVLGNALVARLIQACLMRGVEIIPRIDTVALRREKARIVGVEIRSGDLSREITARRGVVLAGGGFPASADWRARELPAPVAENSPASPGAVGRTLELGRAAGSQFGPAGEDNALWFPSSTMRRRDGSLAVYPHIVLDRAKPGSLVVDRTGRRFVNEAVSYHEFVRAMYRANAVPCWMICDRDFIRRYGLGLIRPRTRNLGPYVRDGYLAQAHDIIGLAETLGLPAQTLMETVVRFNDFAEIGRDDDFGRGESIYDRANGDPEYGPNPCLGPIGQGPVFAVKLEPTPLGTSRGLVTDIQARALDANGEAISGLYVCGNDMQSAFGGEYPGAGAQLGQAMTFGWIAARHAAGAKT
ncbi:FAD-dependent oxidoreductase [Tropicimonas marinistellae]|uniref:FAD-dependent oxidoreductase n=1 Tax=Tropicimonas marinistellae TaxID=1739787 RepID=UPI000831DD6C|nr:FAD-dependent oxidoreductase [Tropicimonas marinistellae]